MNPIRMNPLVESEGIELSIQHRGNVYFLYFKDTNTRARENEIIIKWDTDNEYPFSVTATEDDNYRRGNDDQKYTDLRDALLSAGVPKFQLPLIYNLAVKGIYKWNQSQSVSSNRRSFQKLRSITQFGKSKKKRPKKLCKGLSKSKRKSCIKKNKLIIDAIMYETISSVNNYVPGSVYRRRRKKSKKSKKSKR